MASGRWIALALLPMAAAILVPARTESSVEAVNFEKQIRPILKAQCSSCHSRDQAMAGLDLTSIAGLKKGGVSGALWTPGKASASLIVQRIRGLGGKPQMPMGFKPLEAAQIELIVGWIDEGANLTGAAGATHWAYIAPKRPPTPKVPAWMGARNPIDAFVFDRLRKEGLKPSPQANRTTMLRRLSLDLIGLPPSPEEVDAFLADRSPDAYNRVVDRLLRSPHFGEKQSRAWLDLARYADTHGYEADRTRTMWPYRDWVIDAFNRNMPYDQFVIEQMAGDLLPNASQDNIIATGFHRNAMTNEEGGVDPGEQLFNVLLDRVATTSTVFMGSTLQCARCHDHKYDPFSQKDHYAMYGFFNATDAKLVGDANVGQARYYEPEMRVMPAAVRARLEEGKRAIAELEREIAKPDANRVKEFEAWLRSVDDPVSFTAAVPLRWTAEGGATFSSAADGAILVAGPNPAKDAYEIDIACPKGTTAISIEALPHPSLENGGFGRSSSGNIVLTKLAASIDGQRLPLAAFGADYVQFEYDISGLEKGADDSGWALSPKYREPHRLIAQLAAPLPAQATVRLRLEFRSPWEKHGLGHFRLSHSQSPFPMNQVLSEYIRGLVKKEPKTAIERNQLEGYFHATASSLAALREKLYWARAKVGEIEAAAPMMLVMRDSPAKSAKAPLYHRGEFLSPKEEIAADTPSFLPKMGKDLPRNRLGLARWLVSRNNPLAARVQVNRMWEQIFGRGIVETVEDFGTQCSPPSHPELLDWLAVELMDSGWNLKHILHLIVTSATYRQSANATPALLQRDPANELLARGPRFRLEAETIRDAALAASGLLNRKIGGPSVFPYQPEGVWDSPYSGERWNEAKNDERYRRGIYVFWKRTAPYPSFMALDAGSREQCSARRTRTNTPLQALALLNDPAYFEAARALAARAASSTPDRSIERVFRYVLCRRPERREADRLLRLYREARTKLQSEPGSTAKIAESADLAALTLVANVVLNLDEALTKN